MKRKALGAALLAAATLASAAPKGDPRLLRIDAALSFTEGDFSAEYTIVQDKPGEGKILSKAAVFRRDAVDTYLILMIEPAEDKGKGYLKAGDGLWFYDPADRRFTFTNAEERFRESNARNSDFGRSTYATDFRVTAERRETLGKFDCAALDLEATSSKATFPKSRLWVTDDGLVRKVEDYSLSGQLMRTIATPSYQKVGGHYAPTMILIVDNLRGKQVEGKFVGERTQITITKASTAPQPDAIYSKAYLEKVAK